MTLYATGHGVMVSIQVLRSEEMGVAISVFNSRSGHTKNFGGQKIKSNNRRQPCQQVWLGTPSVVIHLFLSFSLRSLDVQRMF